MSRIPEKRIRPRHLHPSTAAGFNTSFETLLSYFGDFSSVCFSLQTFDVELYSLSLNIAKFPKVNDFLTKNTFYISVLILCFFLNI